MTQQAGDWMWWRAALAGHRQAVTIGEPQVGYWRRKFKATKTRPGSDEAVAIWKDATGAWQCLVGRMQRVADKDRIYEIFESCCKTPVTYEHYKHWIAHTVWPGDLPAELGDVPDLSTDPVKSETPRGIGDNSGAAEPLADEAPQDPHAIATKTIAETKAAYETWFSEIGKAIVDQDQADVAGNYRDRFTKLERRSDECREDEKRPHLEAGRAVDEKWRPIIADARAFKADVLKAIDAYFALVRRREQEARAAAAEAQRKAAEEAAAAGQPAPEPTAPPADPTPAPAPLRAGTSGRRVKAKMVKCVRIVDIEKVKEAFITTPNFDFAMKEWVEKFGPTSAIPIPGTEQFQEERAG